MRKNISIYNAIGSDIEYEFELILNKMIPNIPSNEPFNLYQLSILKPIVFNKDDFTSFIAEGFIKSEYTFNLITKFLIKNDLATYSYGNKIKLTDEGRQLIHCKKLGNYYILKDLEKKAYHGELWTKAFWLKQIIINGSISAIFSVLVSLIINYFLLQK